MTESEDRDGRLRDQVARLLEERRGLGLDGRIGDLVCAVINTEPDRLEAAAQDLLAHTGHDLADAFETDDRRVVVLAAPNSADLLLQCRLRDPSPFAGVNRYPKSAHLPDTRLETLVFACDGVADVARIQRGRGTRFLTDAPVTTNAWHFIQTAPSKRTGNSVGLIAWRGREKRYRPKTARDWNPPLSKPPRAHLANIGLLDHIATRVHAQDRDDAILEFMDLTNYAFDFAIYVPDLNSITNVARLPGAQFAQVFTSGIRTDGTGEPGPTEEFIRNYGPRVHHMAFLTRNIESTDRALREDGLGFLSDLVGDEADGIRQSFSVPSPHTLLVNEYIERYHGFDGFFTTHNVTKLTRATAGQ